MRILDSSPSLGTPPFVRAIVERLNGPGGYYNLGNAIALSSGIAFQFVNTPETQDPLARVGSYLVGDIGATWLTVSMLFFFASGEMYYRAWAGRQVPDGRLNRRGDLLSGFGAIALTVALIHFGDIALAIVAGTLLAGGKFGTAILPPAVSPVTGRLDLKTWLRVAVVASRVPSLAALSLELARIIHDREPVSNAIMPSIMLACFTLWLWADVLLVRGQRQPSSQDDTDGLR
ncbi:MAG: hypothetical protein WA989_04890 [Henriciella sp.]|uniref:hypothetical protein n=1 Tax=Henriciella sp. TaxID=1968823 RepID=UPI003C77CFBA